MMPGLPLTLSATVGLWYRLCRCIASDVSMQEPHPIYPTMLAFVPECNGRACSSLVTRTRRRRVSGASMNASRVAGTFCGRADAQPSSLHLAQCSPLCCSWTTQNLAASPMYHTQRLLRPRCSDSRRSVSFARARRRSTHVLDATFALAHFPAPRNTRRLERAALAFATRLHTCR